MPLQAKLSAFALLLVSACSAVGPDPAARPELALPVTYVGADAAPAEGEVTARAFWTAFNDPVLTGFIHQGLSTNLSVAAADERIRAAQAGLRATGVVASQFGGSSSLGTMRAGNLAGQVAEIDNTSLSAAFVIDLFGGAQRMREAAGAGLMSAEAGAQTARLAWIAEVIAAYGNARYYQETLALTRATLATRARTLDITRAQVDAGSATLFDLSQAEAETAMARAEMPSMEAAFNAQVFRLATLLDQPAAPLMAQLQRGAPMLRTPPTPRAGVPADLLRNRPDLVAAEYQLQAAVAQVGVAEAELYPSISLAGSVGTSSPGADSWSFGPQISLPILNQPALRSARDAAASEARQAEIAWRAAVSQAVADVQTAQSALRSSQQRAALLRSADEALQRTYDLALQNFEAGSLPLLDLLQIDRSRAQGRLSIAAARNDSAQAWAQLQIALGAGSAIR